MGGSGHKDALLSGIDRIENLLVESLNYLRNDYATESIELVDVGSALQTVCSEFADIGHAVRYAGLNRGLAKCCPLSTTRAVANLCDDAVKFAGSAEVTMAERPESAIIIEDNGPGIPQELRQRVLEPFFKSDQSRAEGGYSCESLREKYFLGKAFSFFLKWIIHCGKTLSQRRKSCRATYLSASRYTTSRPPRA